MRAYMSLHNVQSVKIETITCGDATWTKFRVTVADRSEFELMLHHEKDKLMMDLNKAQYNIPLVVEP